MRQPPAKLLGHLVSHRLLPFHAEWFLQSGNIKPVLLLFSLGDHSSAVANQPVHQCDPCAIRLAFHAVRQRHVLRHKNVCLETSLGCVGRQCASGVSGRRNRKLLQAVIFRHRNRGGKAASLERTGRIQAFILDKNIRELATGQHGSEAFA